jgi:hypothetical protein
MGGQGGMGMQNQYGGMPGQYGMYTCIFIHVYMYLYVCMWLCIYIYMYLSIYKYIHKINMAVCPANTV